MTPQPQPDHNGSSLLTKRHLSLIHIAKKALGLDEDDYRDLLERVTGRRSATEIEPGQLMALQKELRRCGWRGYLLRRDEVPPLRYQGLKQRPDRPTPAQLRKLDVLFKTCPGYGTIDGDAALRAFLRKRFNVDDARFLNRKQYESALNGIRQIRKRAGVAPDGEY